MDAGPLTFTVTVSELRKVEYVLTYNLTSSPAQMVSPVNPHLRDNAVGLTVIVGGATTVGGEILAVGF